ncbi:hypothetical protein CL634_08170 [bacterium]|nr:hypothetical protein [bacterium]
MATYERKDYNYRVYDFKSVGQSLEAYKESNRLLSTDIVKRPIGIKTPVALSYGNTGLLEMHLDLQNQIRDNFRNLLLTNHGDRLGLYDFGANLKSLVFELGNSEFDTMAIIRIKSAVAKYMPFISLETFEPFDKKEETSQDLACVGLRIKYAVPAAKMINQQIEVIIWTAG